MSPSPAPQAGHAVDLDARAILRFVGLAGGSLLLAYALLFFPHGADSVLTHALRRYLRTLATVVGAVLSLAGERVTVQEEVILGRFPLRIVLDCAALEAQALLVAFVVAFPAPWRLRLVGVLAGLAALTLANIGRIIVLYFVGALRPEAFGLVHEEIMQIALVLIAAGLFAAWIGWTRGLARMPPA